MRKGACACICVRASVRKGGLDDAIELQAQEDEEEKGEASSGAKEENVLQEALQVEAASPPVSQLVHALPLTALLQVVPCARLVLFVPETERGAC